MTLSGSIGECWRGSNSGDPTYDYPTTPTGIDAKKAYYYKDKNGDLDYIVVEPKSGSSFKKKKYNALKGQKAIIVETSNLSYENKSVLIKYTFIQTARKYSDPDVYAAFIGVLAEVGIPYQGTGNTSKDATGYPSNTHVNGFGWDFCYQGNDKDQKVINAMRNFGCSKFYVGSNLPYKNLIVPTGSGKNSLHNSHLHCGPFDNLKVQEQKD